ncbi:hypothetical protein DPMN_002724 [Dreissena polymorpha]|uniref:Uncharacterized protein n=1 Tax=Dreissena polymorpha TaxID=45954 RepID=A0A9D4MMV8_DREPO|nr:hypothetical protein DPMN_002724 [Dreissena polymorpha]
MAILEDKGKRLPPLTMASDARPEWAGAGGHRARAHKDRVEYKEVTGPVVEPCLTHVPLISLVVNEHLLYKLLAFSIEQRAEEFTRKLKLLQLKSFPCDLTIFDTTEGLSSNKTRLDCVGGNDISVNKPRDVTNVSV